MFQNVSSWPKFDISIKISRYISISLIHLILRSEKYKVANNQGPRNVLQQSSIISRPTKVYGLSLAQSAHAPKCDKRRKELARENCPCYKCQLIPYCTMGMGKTVLEIFAPGPPFFKETIVSD